MPKDKVKYLLDHQHNVVLLLFRRETYLGNSGRGPTFCLQQLTIPEFEVSVVWVLLSILYTQCDRGREFHDVVKVFDVRDKRGKR